MAKKKLKNISEIRRYFHRNEAPIYFISATNFNLLGLDEWVRNFKYINYLDCYDGKHPNVFCPSEQPHAEFQSIEDINNYLLQHKELIDWTKKRGGKPKFVFLMFDEQTEKLAKELGAEVWFPKAKLRTRVDNKIETVRIGNKAGVPSVPNTLAVVKDYKHLCELTEKAKIGNDLVLQSAFGDSGHTTFFIKSEADFRRHEHEIVGCGEIKIMKRINCRGSAIEACATKQGTIVGPLFHLLEFSGQPFDLDIEELNARWADPNMIDSWSQMVIKHTEDSVDIITQAPETGIYRMLSDGSVVFDRFDYHRRAVESEKEAFFLRILKPGDYRYEGADLGILVTRGRSMTDSFKLADRSKKWIKGIKSAFSARPLPAAAPSEHAFKIL